MEPKYLTVEQIFDKEDQYTIPIYQRNYAWEESQIGQLVRDIYDVYQEGNNYYLGSLIVHNRNTEYETIDGQQRLTTLNILACVLKHVKGSVEFFNNVDVNLRFDSRTTSNKTLEYFNNNGNASTTLKLHEQMKQAYEIIEKKFQELFGIDYAKTPKFHEYISYLLEKVKILRIQVPEETDLNHYFEVMNNRGEQLEKHEVLKAKFLEVLSKSERSELYSNTFSLIWEACSYMDRYVQYVFKPDDRKALFGEYWDEMQFEIFEEICDKVSVKKEKFLLDEGQKPTLEHIVLGTISIDETEGQSINEEGLERFTPVTSFPHFLLQVLRVTVNSEVQLDDKKLIPQFKEHLLDKDNALELTKIFANKLLYSKFLFDNYIVKRDYNNDKESWAILRMKKQESHNIGYYVNTFEDNNQHNKLVYLQSMFHVSFPQTNYKHWLSACLKFLIDEDDVQLNQFIEYLEELSNAFYFNRLNGLLNYHNIIFKNQGYEPIINLSNEMIETHFNIGTNVNNFIFNRLDYLLYYNLEAQKQLVPLDQRDDVYFQFNKNDYEFNFRSSVEHYAPQNPKNNDHPISNVHNFGNLCLISASRNSEFSNKNIQEKKASTLGSKNSESLKQRLMMCYKDWNENTVDEHQTHMIELLNTKTTNL